MTLDEIRTLRRHCAHEAAREALVALVAARPGDATLRYEAACVHAATERRT